MFFYKVKFDIVFFNAGFWALYPAESQTPERLNRVPNLVYLSLAGICDQYHNNIS